MYLLISFRSQIPHKIFNLLFIITNSNIMWTVLSTGAEVMITYGDKGNAELLTNYGM